MGKRNREEKHVSVCIHRTKGILVSQGDADIFSLRTFLGGNMDRKLLVTRGAYLRRRVTLALPKYVQYEVIYILAPVPRETHIEFNS